LAALGAFAAFGAAYFTALAGKAGSSAGLVGLVGREGLLDAGTTLAIGLAALMVAALGGAFLPAFLIGLAALAGAFALASFSLPCDTGDCRVFLTYLVAFLTNLPI
jgi:hypothetical protein